MAFKKRGIGNSGKSETNSTKIYQHDYVDVIKSITPDLYADTDYAIYGQEDDILYSVLGKVLKTVEAIGNIIDIHDITDEDLKRRFILRNNLTHIRANTFENKILKAVGKSFSDFESKYAFKQYLENELLPSIRLNSPTQTFRNGVRDNVDSSINTPDKVKKFLLDTLSWVYMLNSTNAPAGGYHPYRTISKYLADLYDDHVIQEKEGIFMLFEYLWYNMERRDAQGGLVVDQAFKNFIPVQFAKSQTEVSGVYFASGNQQLQNLKTLLGVWYNPSDEKATTLDHYLDMYRADGVFTPKQVEGGAVTKFLQAVSYGFYDVNSTVSELEDLIDIERCPPEFLQYLATLIGWKLLTGDVDRWRAQLRKAVYLYKSKGTKRCLADAISLILPGITEDITDNIKENWELYLPRMLYYLISTSSPVLRDKDYAFGTLAGVKKNQIFDNNLDLNSRTATDYVIRTLHEITPPTATTPEGGVIYINGSKFSLSSWDPTDVNFPGFLHRGRPNVEIPPWEDDRFYDTTFLGETQVKILNEILLADRKAATINLPNGGTAAIGGGLELPVAFVSSLSSIVLKKDVPDATYTYTWNMKWKSYSLSSIAPPNLLALTSAKDTKSLSMLDSWCSKSSFIFSNIQVANISHSVEGVQLSLSNIMANITSIFRSFIPFHVIFRLFAEASFNEVYTPSGSFCLTVDRLLYTTSAGGDTDQTVLTNLVPSSISVSAGVVTSHPSTPRTSGRRRDLKYLFNHAVFTRNGKAMPIPGHFYSASAGVEPSGIVEFKVNSSEFIPLGYNFSSGLYFSPSGSLSGVYDSSCDLAMSSMELEYLGDPTLPGTEYYMPLGARTRDSFPHSTFSYSGITVSSTFPCRAPMEVGCNSIVRRDNISTISELVIHKMISVLSSTDDFGEKHVNKFKFGRPVHIAFHDASGDISQVVFSYDDPTHDIPYSKKEVEIIFSYFNELAATKSSRLNSNSSGTYGSLGGHRGYYIDNFGGDTYGASSTILALSGVTYNVEDD